MRRKEKTPKVKFNGGNPVALCLKCDATLCYVSYDIRKVVYIVKFSGFQYSVDNLSPGDKVPLYCKNCEVKELMIEKV